MVKTGVCHIYDTEALFVRSRHENVMAYKTEDTEFQLLAKTMHLQLVS